MLESFHLGKNWEKIEDLWRQKNLISAEILGENPLRQMRPELIGDRRRLDLMWNGQALGIRGRTRADESFEFFPIEKPDTAPAEIHAMMEDWLEAKPALKLAQVRFRLGVQGERGLWLDIANLDIKNLLEESTFLRTLIEKNFIVEMGQKHKEVRLTDSGELEFAEATPRNWLASFDVHNQAIPLLATQSQFSQPGPEVNRALIATAFELLEAQGVQVESWCEWGAGYGNLSAAFASKLGTTNAWSSEFEPHAARLLQINAEKFFPQVRVARQAAEGQNFPEAQLWLADPPRPGFPALFARLPSLAHKPQWILTFHCHQKGLISDCREIKNGGYELKHWSSVDAFPGTPHHEVISLWEKK